MVRSSHELPTDLKELCCYRDELAVENGLIFKGRQVLIPKELRQVILTQLHNGQQGIEKTRNLARETVYWLGIAGDIQLVCESCQLCQEMQPLQPRQPMKMHEKLGMRWVKGGADLFEADGCNFFIISDYFSRYPVIKKLTSAASSSIIAATKETFALLGVPREVMSDNGPSTSQHTITSARNGVQAHD